jgi:hypothetical protein
MSLVINQTYAKLNIQTTPSNLAIETRSAKLELTHKEASVEIHTELPRVEVDQYECFATSGLMSANDLTREAAQMALQQALAYISKVAGDGDSMAAIESKTNPIPSIVERDAFPEKEFGMDVMPKARPQITVTGGIRIQSPGSSEGNYGVQGRYTPGSINMNYTPANVNISMAQYASINIRNEKTGFNKTA